jgi:hypothetical protein
MRFVDRFGNEIDHCISLIQRQVFWENYLPEVICVVDDIARPDKKQLADIRQKHTGKREREK